MVEEFGYEATLKMKQTMDYVESQDTTNPKIAVLNCSLYTTGDLHELLYAIRSFDFLTVYSNMAGDAIITGSGDFALGALLNEHGYYRVATGRQVETIFDLYDELRALDFETSAVWMSLDWLQALQYELHYDTPDDATLNTLITDLIERRQNELHTYDDIPF
jgi:hypothetical protein